MQTTKNIVLIGFMGTGKTTVGTLLSERTGMPLVDMDSLIEARAGKAISAIFAEDGEPRFREYERELTIELAQLEGQIISTGGGIVVNPNNVTDFSKKGFVVCLLASAEEILKRVKHDESRPLLAGDKQQKIVELLEQRRPLYEAIEHSVHTDGKEPKQVADEIFSAYKQCTS